MKKIFTLCSLIITILSINAQTPIYDSIAMGSGYKNAIFYSMANATVGSAPIYSTSDIQIRFDGRSASIRTVDGINARLYLPVNHATTDWSSIDTNGMVEQTNSDTAWENGAYNATATVHPNYGWGTYDGATHDIIGDKIFVHKTDSGYYKKVWIIKLNSVDKSYYIRHANLDGSEDYTDTIGTSDFPNKYFGYFNYRTRTKVDAEPVGTAWDIVFRKYDRDIDNYQVVGVLSNINVLTARLNTPTPNTASGSGLPYYSNMSVIGYDWKDFTPPGGPWVVYDTIAYFILDKSNDIWRIVFTGYSGSAAGKVYFTKTKLAHIPGVGIENPINDNISLATLYPNPINENSIIAYTSINDEPVQISIINAQGNLVNSESIASKKGLNIYAIGNKNLANGMYFIQVNQNGENHTLRMFVAK